MLMWDAFRGDDRLWFSLSESVGVVRIMVRGEDDEMHPCYVNAKDIPNGPKAETAIYVGSFRHER